MDRNSHTTLFMDTVDALVLMGDPEIQAALEWLDSLRKPDEDIYDIIDQIVRIYASKYSSTDEKYV